MSRPRREIALLRAFSAPRALTLQQLCQIFRCSRATILRRLVEHGYYSSYNHSGKFLTIPEVAQFDSHGLWTWKAARFSKHGTLKQTVAYLTQSSPQGTTHEELATLLAVRVHNVLLQLVREGTLRRERIGPTFVYLHAQRPSRSEQVKQRRATLAARPTVRPTSQQTIATLLQLIQDPQATQQEIISRCQRGGVPLTPQVIEAIFQRYELDKKRAL
jgi:hypothetical protein